MGIGTHVSVSENAERDNKYTRRSCLINGQGPGIDSYTVHPLHERPAPPSPTVRWPSTSRILDAGDTIPTERSVYRYRVDACPMI